MIHTFSETELQVSEEKNWYLLKLAKGTPDLDLINILSSKQKLQQALKSWSAWFCLVKENTDKNFDKSIEQLKQIYVKTLTNPCQSLDKSMLQL